MATQIDLGAVVPIGKGDWNSSATYERANIVRHNSTAWICKVTTSKGVEPSESSSDWYLLVKDMSAVTSINGMRGDVTIDSILTNPSIDNNSLKIASTSWVKTKVDNAVDGVNTELSQVSSTANTALQTANSAQSSASTAQNTANNALTKATTVFAGSTSGIVPEATSANANSVLRGNGTWSNIGLGPISEKSQALDNVSGTRAINLSSGLFISATITGATTFSFTNIPTNAVVVVLQLTNGGSQTITWPSSIKWAGGTAPKLTASGIDIIVLTTNNAGNAWYGIANLKYV